MQGKHVAALVVAIIIGFSSVAGVMWLNNSGYKSPLLTPNSAVPATNVPQAQSAAQPVGTPTSWSGRTAAVVITNNDRDILASTTLTDGTNVQSTYWGSSDGFTFTFKGASTTSASGTTVNITPDMNGVFYIVMQPVSGQSYYIAPLSTQNSNACITGYDFMDIQGSGTKQWVFKCDMSKSGLAPSTQNAGGSGGTAPLMTLYTNAYAYTAPTANSDTTNVLSIGLATTDKNNAVYYTLTGTTKNAFALTELDMQVNSTNSTRYNPSLSYWQFPTQDPRTYAITTTQLFFSSANQVYNDGTNSYWKYIFQAPLDTTFGVTGSQSVQNLKGAYFYVVPSTAASGKFQFTANIVTDFQGSVAHQGWKMTAFYVQPSGAIGSVTKTVNLCSDSACS